jgi:hypothetical protein
MRIFPTNKSAVIGETSAQFLLFILLVMGCASTYAQNPGNQTIIWNSIKAINQADSKEVVYNCSFKTYATQSLDWVQGTHRSNFTVTSTDGQWTDLSQDGQETYNVQNGSITGSFLFSRNAGQYSLHMKLYVDGKLDQDYVFTISSISPAQ